MKNTLVFLFPVFCLCCGKQQPEMLIPPHSTLRSIESRELTAIMQIHLPETMDSSATWASDCCTGGVPATGYWDHRYPFVKTRHGLCFPDKLADSIYQVTFYTNKERYGNFVIDTAFLEKTIKERDPMKFESIESITTEIKSIGQHQFLFLKYPGQIRNYWVKHDQSSTETVELMTYVDSCSVFISFECAGSNCAGFIERMLPYIETIRFVTKNPVTKN